MTSLGSRAARGGAITLAFQAAKVLLMLVSTIVLARLLNPEDFGLVAMVTALIGVAEIFRDFGLSMAALQAKELSQRQQSNLFWINSLVGLVLTILGMALAGPISSFYGDPRLEPIVLACSSVFLLGGLTTQFRVRINRDLRFFTLSWIDFAPYVIAFAVAVLFASRGAGYWALVAQQVALAVSALVLAVALARWWPSLPHRGESMRPLLNFGFSFATTQLLSYATRNLDSVAIGRVWGADALGFYNRAYQLVTAPLSQINTPLSRVAVPVLARITDDKPRYLRFLRQAQLIATYVTSSLLLLLAGIGTPLVVMTMGSAWSAAGPILSILAIGGVFRSISQISYWIFMSNGLAAQQLRFFLVAQPTVLVVMLLGLPWGGIGVAIGNAVGYALYWVASLAWAGRCAEVSVGVLFRDSSRIIGVVGLPILAVSLLSTALLPMDWLRVAAALGAALVWLLVAYALFPFVRRDLHTLIRIGRRATGRAS